MKNRAGLARRFVGLARSAAAGALAAGTLAAGTLAAGTVAAGVLVPALPALAAEPTSAAKVRILLHTWLVRDPITASPYSFRVRRANVYVTGQVTEHWGYNILFDPALILAPVAPGNQVPSYAILKDAYVIYDRDWFKLNLGQMKVPVSDEFLRSAISMDTIERSAFATKALTKDFGFMRDIGALATLDAGFGKVMGGVYNGSGDNIASNAEFKSFIGRVELAPMGEMLKLGGSYLNGYKKGTDTKGAEVNGTRARYGANAEVKIGPVRVGGEGLIGFDDSRDNNQKLGYYGQILWAIVPEHEALVRLEAWNPDTGLVGDKSVQQYSAGLGWNWRIRGAGTKVQLNYFHDFLPKGVQDDRILTSFGVYL